MESPVANSHTGPERERSGIDLDSSPGIIDFQVRERRSELLKIACEIAAAGRGYREIHNYLFGFTIRRALMALFRNKPTDFSGIESRLETLAEDARHIEHEMVQGGFNQLPRRAVTAIAFRDALLQYARAVSESTEKLLGMCRAANKECLSHKHFIVGAEAAFRQDRVAYDASYQEFRRWGERLTELTEKI